MTVDPITSPPPEPGDRLRLFLLGFLTLFLELVLIRFLAGNIWNLGYFPNLVLLAVFIGMGFGFLLHHLVGDRRSPWLFQGAGGVLLLLVAFVKYLNPAFPGLGVQGGEIGGELYFSAAPEAGSRGNLLMFAVWFLSVLVTFALISQRTAKLFRLFSPLGAYTLDIAGSCCGIASFMVLSWLRVPGAYWFLIALPLFIAALPRSAPWIRGLPVLPFGAVFILALSQDAKLMSVPEYPGELEVHWSPYQKVEYVNFPRNPVPQRIYVNGVAHQAMGTADQIRGGLFYQVPHDDRKALGREPYRSVLIIGAGLGNDVACALMNGAERVDAVEIDPVIADLGRKYHPENPYGDPRVTLTVDDGRAFMTRTPHRYDLIVFALTDSLVKVSSMAQLRLENYLFTTDSMGRAYGLLTESGDVALYNDYRRDWLIEKYQRMIHAATGKYAVTIKKDLTAETLIFGRDRFRDEPPAFAYPQIEIPTDDWPFPYLKERRLPRVYTVALGGAGGLVLILALLLHLVGRGREEGKANLPTKLAFIFMGVAFLLLETKSIVQFSLLFGTTWLNTSLVFLAVLLLVLGANWCALLFRQAWVLPIIYVLLVASCLVGFFIPPSRLLVLESAALRFVLASLMTFSPIFFANLVFSISFRDQPIPEHIFGWNLLGASVGGLLEYSSLVLGYNALAVIVAVSYTLVILLILAGRRGGAAASPSGESVAG